MPKVKATDVLLDVLNYNPDKVVVIYIKDDELDIDGNTSYLETLGALDLARDITKEMLEDEE